MAFNGSDYDYDGRRNYGGRTGGGAWYGGNTRGYGDRPYAATTYEDAENAIAQIQRYGAAKGRLSSRDNREIAHWRERMAELQGQHDAELAMEEYREQFGEYMDMMNEYLASMSEAMNYEAPAQEPLKNAVQEQDDARSDTNRKQLLRRGLMSTYTRYGSQGQKLGA